MQETQFTHKRVRHRTPSYGTERVEVFSATHGIGVRAVVAVRKNEVVLVEEPLFTAPAGQSYFSIERMMDPVLR